MERLDRQVDAYIGWKRDLIREITRYRSWLAHNRLTSEAVDARLERALRLLRTDHITLAFVGEFSRGKTELINSLFFANFGRRILPSQAGRTTMCPTELFFDPRSERSYIRLLPIETRLEDAGLAQLRRMPRQWLQLPLDPHDPTNMAEAFGQIATTKAVPAEVAIELGFDAQALEPADVPGKVLVPAWRHALVNFDHPLLRQGLRVIDTPGLNALGSEPELTLSMLPNAQAVLFMLSADAGITASDMQIWQRHIAPLGEDTEGNLFAILNKIDVLWDDLAGEGFVQESIDQIRATTAQQLGICVEDVLPLSAKQALLARARNDEALLERSRIDQLERLLSERVLAHKERLIEEGVVQQVLSLMHNSQQVLNGRLERITEQRNLLDERRQGSGQTLLELTARTRHEHNRHHKRLLDLKTNQRLLQRQGEQLRVAIRAERLQEHLGRLRRSLTGSLTTLGINLAIQHFFRSLDQDLAALELEAQRANKMLEAIYRRHNEENPLHGLDAPSFRTEPFLRELRGLQHKADQFRRQLKTLLTEQHALTRRFFATLVQEVIGLHARVRQQADLWASDALTPLLQFSLEHKQQIEGHMLQLKQLASDARRGELLARYVDELQQQAAQAGEMLRALRRPSPIRRQHKVVNLVGLGLGQAERAGDTG